MWIVRMILWALIMLILVFFASENSQQEVQVLFWKWESQPVPLWLVMFLSFAVGVLVWIFGSIFKIIQMKNEVRRLRKKNQKLTAELEHLRSVSIEEETKLETDTDNSTMLLP